MNLVNELENNLLTLTVRKYFVRFNVSVKNFFIYAVQTSDFNFTVTNAMIFAQVLLKMTQRRCPVYTDDFLQLKAAQPTF